MSFSLGTINEFNPDSEDFRLYVDRLENWFLANSVTEEKKVSVFLSMIGSKAYLVLNNLCMPLKPSKSTYAQLVAKLIHHYSPPRIIIAERYKFHQRSQLPGETLADFMVEIRRLASTCSFGTTLDETWRQICMRNIKFSDAEKASSCC